MYCCVGGLCVALLYGSCSDGTEYCEEKVAWAGLFGVNLASVIGGGNDMILLR